MSQSSFTFLNFKFLARKGFMAICLSSLAFSSSAAEVVEGVSDGGKVVHVASVNGALLFTIKGGVQSSRPTCADTKRFAVPEKSGHAAVVLTAFSTGKPFGNIRGTGLCSLWPNAEDIRWIEVCPLGGCE